MGELAKMVAYPFNSRQLFMGFSQCNDTTTYIEKDPKHPYQWQIHNNLPTDKMFQKTSKPHCLNSLKNCWLLQSWAVRKRKWKTCEREDKKVAPESPDDLWVLSEPLGMELASGRDRHLKTLSSTGVKKLHSVSSPREEKEVKSHTEASSLIPRPNLNLTPRLCRHPAPPTEARVLGRSRLSVMTGITVALLSITGPSLNRTTDRLESDRMWQSRNLRSSIM